MLASDCPANRHTKRHYLTGCFFNSLQLLFVLPVEQDIRVQVSIPSVEYIGDLEIIFVTNFKETL